jgi:hypothetical protein
MRKFTISVLSLLVIALLAACIYLLLFPVNVNWPTATHDSAAPRMAMMSNAMVMPSSYASNEASATSRQIIHTASINLSVSNLQDTLQQLQQLASQLQGYVQSTYINGEDGNNNGSVVLAIPDSVFSQAMSKIRQIGVHVDSEQINTADVTSQYIDLNARLKVAQAAQDQYLKLLAQAKTVSDTLQVTNSLSQAQAQVESLKGQLQYLQHQLDYANITVNFTVRSVVATAHEWRPWQSIVSAGQTLVKAFAWLGSAVIWLIIFVLPLALIFAIIFYLVYKIVRTKK